MTEVSPEDRAEQQATPTRDAAATERPDVDVEATEADLLEQAVATGPGEHTAAREVPLEADPADAAEQAVVVELDEDDRR
ncbi:MAG: hypothetical protein JWN08_2360 [Frankiales bacterium]|nr:hypothetical protein [Frankiales bacterium]